MSQHPTQISEVIEEVLALYQNKAFEEAEKHCLLFIPLFQGESKLWYLLGIICEELKEYSRSVEAYKQAINHDSEDALYDYQIAHAYLHCQNIEAAKAHLLSAIKKRENFFEAYESLAHIHTDENELENALDLHKKSLRFKPDSGNAFNDIGNIMVKMGQIEEAYKYYQKAVDQRPDIAKYYINLGNCCCTLKKFEGAKSAYQNAIDFDPLNDTVYIQLAELHLTKQQYIEALDIIDQALLISPNSTQANKIKTHIFLTVENYKEGWSLHERRLERFAFWQEDKTKQPIHWKKEEYHNKELLVLNEGTTSESLCMLRFLPALAKIASKVSFQGTSPLQPLLKSSDLNVEICEPYPTELNSQHDKVIPLQSLPYLLEIDKETIPFIDGYLKSDPTLVKKYQKDYFQTKNKKIGLLWKREDSLVTLEDLSPLFELDNTTFFTFYNAEDTSDEINAFSHKEKITRLPHCGEKLDELAALIENCDLIISVDSPMAHLAGALGKKGYILLPFDKILDWKWQYKPREAPWYSSLEVLREVELKRWNKMIPLLKNTIESYLES